MAGVPTVTLATTDFYTLAVSASRSKGMLDQCIVQVPHPMGGIPAEEVIAKVDANIDKILDACVNWKPNLEAAANAAQKAYPLRRFKFKGTYADVNNLYWKRGWSLSLPIVPPTDEAVAEMLKGTDRDPSEVIWVVPPRMGQLTVEGIATLGVMAGAKPEHMPLLIAVAEAFASPLIGWQGSTTTTNPNVPLVIISGPVVEKLGLNAGTGTGSNSNPAQNAIGYFVNLVGDIVGGSRHPDVDKTTQGSPMEIVCSVVCENEPRIPALWGKTFREEQGFKKEDSIVTVICSVVFNHNQDHSANTATMILDTLSATVAGAAIGSAGTPCLAPYDPPKTTAGFGILLLAPEHADTIAHDGVTREQASEYLAAHAVLPMKAYAGSIGGKCRPGPEWNPLTPETLVPRYSTGRSIYIVVTGGPGKHSQFWPAFQTVAPSSVKIQGY